MAQRRMFSLQIVDTDAFLEMPQSSQLLYFHLAMRADDEGFVSNPRKIMKILGSGDDDFKVLIAKKFILPFESGICVIKHWLIHNLIRMDRFGETSYKKERSLLTIKDNKSYSLKLDNNIELATKCIPSGNQVTPQVKISKVKLSKDNIIKDNLETKVADPINSLLKEFEPVNPIINYGNKTHRRALEELVKKYGEEKVRASIKYTVSISGQKYAPTITNPYQLKEKLGELIIYQKKESNNNPIII